jgi:predicted nucleotidyltransferase
MTPEGAIAARRRQRASLIDVAHSWVVASREGGARITEAWVFGSVARGDHHIGSDIDVLVVATGLPDHPIDRLRTLAPLSGRVEAVVWSPEELTAAEERGDEIAVEVATVGVDVRAHPAPASPDRT